jgi:hypothetical protein
LARLSRRWSGWPVVATAAFAAFVLFWERSTNSGTLALPNNFITCSFP